MKQQNDATRSAMAAQSVAPQSLFEGIPSCEEGLVQGMVPDSAVSNAVEPESRAAGSCDLSEQTPWLFCPRCGTPAQDAGAAALCSRCGFRSCPSC